MESGIRRGRKSRDRGEVGSDYNGGSGQRCIYEACQRCRVIGVSGFLRIMGIFLYFWGWGVLGFAG